MISIVHMHTTHSVCACAHEKIHEQTRPPPPHLFRRVALSAALLKDLGPLGRVSVRYATHLEQGRRSSEREEAVVFNDHLTMFTYIESEALTTHTTKQVDAFVQWNLSLTQTPWGPPPADAQYRGDLVSQYVSIAFAATGKCASLLWGVLVSEGLHTNVHTSMIVHAPYYGILQLL